MKWHLRFFNVLIILLAIGCAPGRKAAKQSMELNTEAASRAKTDTTISSLLNEYPDLFDSLLKEADKRKIRIIYTRIDRNSQNKPSFKTYNFDPGANEYHYPASTVKLPVAILALQKLNELNIPGLTRNSTMITEATTAGQTAVLNDPASADGRPTIANYIRKIFLFSDNDAFNRLYEFLGQEYINNSLHKMGYDSVQIIHRLDVVLSEQENRTTNRIHFYDNAGKLVYTKPAEVSKLKYQSRKDLTGKGYISGNMLVEKPFDFSKKNRLLLEDAHNMLQSVLFPESVKKEQRFNLTEEDYSFLYKYMSMIPSESSFPPYDSTYDDAYAKFLMFGGSGPIADTSIRIFNKIGDAYGFLTDVAYIVDHKNGVEFMLSATIYANSDEILNDDHYEYDSIGFPFMKNLGKIIYEHELKRSRPYKPDLSKFKFDYKK